jgi:hypothetical protein
MDGLPHPSKPGQEKAMKRSLAVAVTLLSFSAATQAFGQTGTVKISPQQRTAIKEYVVKKNVKPETIQAQIRVGAPLPADVQLVATPSDWGPQFSRYQYVYAGNRIVLVDPTNRHVVVQIID